MGGISFPPISFLEKVMPYIKLTNPRFANLTGQLPGKNFRGVSFVNGVSATDLPLAVADKIAAQLSGTMLCNAAGVVSGPAGSLNRLPTSIVPERAVPRAESEVPSLSETAIAEMIAANIAPLTKRNANRFVIFGDSRMAQYWSDSASAVALPSGKSQQFRTNALHFLAQANARLGQRMRLVKSYARSGFRTDEYLTDANIESAIATDARWAFMYGIVNDAGQGFPKGDVFDNFVKPAVERLITAGISVVLFTEPGAEGFSANAASRAGVYAYNQKLRQYAETRSSGGVYLFDLASLVLRQSVAGIDLIDAMTTDGVHYTVNMGTIVGRALADFLRPLIPALPIRIASPGEASTALQGFSNPGFMNQASAGATPVATGFSGNVPVGTTGISVPAGWTVAGSLVANALGSKDFKLVITASGAGTFYTSHDLAAWENPGDLIDISAQSEVAGGATGFMGTNLYAQFARSGRNLEMDSLYQLPAGTPAPLAVSEIIDHRIAGECPTGTRSWFTLRLKAHFAAAGSATLLWRNVSVDKRVKI